jgi:hypothetical protein
MPNSFGSVSERDDLHGPAFRADTCVEIVVGGVTGVLVVGSPVVTSAVVAAVVTSPMVAAVVLVSPSLEQPVARSAAAASTTISGRADTLRV